MRTFSGAGKPWVKGSLFALGALGFVAGSVVAFRADSANALLGVSVVLLVVAYLGERIERFSFKHGETEMEAELVEKAAAIEVAGEKIEAELARVVEPGVYPPTSPLPAGTQSEEPSDAPGRPLIAATTRDALIESLEQVRRANDSLANASGDWYSSPAKWGKKVGISNVRTRIVFGRPSAAMYPVKFSIRYNDDAGMTRRIALQIDSHDGHKRGVSSKPRHDGNECTFDYLDDLPRGKYTVRWFSLEDGNDQIESGVLLARHNFVLNPEDRWAGRP